MIKIICGVSNKEKYLVDAINEYTKRISKYTKLEIIEVNDLSLLEDKCLKEEAKLIEKHLDEKDYIITLDIEGKELSSVEFAEKIDEINISNPNITFVIGGSLGLDDSIKERRNFSLSFSKMTFPHQLITVILLEQIYRSFKILNNETYHK